MELTTRKFEISGAVQNYLVLHPHTAELLELKPNDLVLIEESSQGFQILTANRIEQDCAGMSLAMMNSINAKPGTTIKFNQSGFEGVSRIVRKKMDKIDLTKAQIKLVMNAIDNGLMSNNLISAFGTAVAINGLSNSETSYIAEAILSHSKKLTHKKKRIVVDKHSIGGITGNRITPILVPIIAAAGLYIPKISTRAITSAAGTSDVLEVVCPVDLTLEEAREILEKTRGFMVNGYKMGLGQTADKFLNVVKEIKIDPPEMMIASILAKKKAVGSRHVLIDLPTGKNAKLADKNEARKLYYQFSVIGEKLGLNIESVISPGDQPIGTMIGPTLEMKEVLQILQQKGGSHSLRRKALTMAGIIFEMAGKVEKDKGYDLAKQILVSEKALHKFWEIAIAQGAPERVKYTDIPTASYTHTIHSVGGDKVFSASSFNIGLMARTAGAPKEKTAGIILHVDRGSIVNEGDPLLSIYSASESKIDETLELIQTAPPFTMEHSILEHIK